VKFYEKSEVFGLRFFSSNERGNAPRKKLSKVPNAFYSSASASSQSSSETVPNALIKPLDFFGSGAVSMGALAGTLAGEASFFATDTCSSDFFFGEDFFFVFGLFFAAV